MRRAAEVTPRADGQPTILIMPRLTWSSTCGNDHCAHTRCIDARERAYRRCSECERVIEPGSPYMELRDRTGHLVAQQHVTCPEGAL